MAEFDAGSIGGTLKLGVDGFFAGIDRAKEFAREGTASLNQMLQQVLRLDKSPFEAGLNEAGDEAGRGAQDIKEGLGEPELDLDTEGFEGGMLHAEKLMELFPSFVTSFMVDPLLGVADAAKEAGEKLFEMLNEVGTDAGQMALLAEKSGVSTQFLSELSGVAKTVDIDVHTLANGFKFLQINAGEALQSATEGISKQAGKIDELTAKQRALNDEISDQRERSAALSRQTADEHDRSDALERKRASGAITVEQYQREAKAIEETIARRQESSAAIEKNIAKHQEAAAAIDKEIQTLKEAAPAGNKTLEAYERIGVSLDTLRSSNPEGLFRAIKSGLDGIADSNERVALTKEIAGKGGFELIPLFDLPEDEMQKRIDFARRVGDVDDEAAGESGKAWIKLKADVSEAMEGISKKIMEVPLESFKDHQKEITDQIVQDVQKVEGEIGKFWNYIHSEDGKKDIAALESLAQSVNAIADAFGQIG